MRSTSDVNRELSSSLASIGVRSQEPPPPPPLVVYVTSMIAYAVVPPIEVRALPRQVVGLVVTNVLDPPRV